MPLTLLKPYAAGAGAAYWTTCSSSSLKVDGFGGGGARETPAQSPGLRGGRGLRPDEAAGRGGAGAAARCGTGGGAERCGAGGGARRGTGGGGAAARAPSGGAAGAAGLGWLGGLGLIHDAAPAGGSAGAVSYTHLTLPTILLV